MVSECPTVRAISVLLDIFGIKTKLVVFLLNLGGFAFGGLMSNLSNHIFGVLLLNIVFSTPGYSPSPLGGLKPRIRIPSLYGVS